jgi:hypothetical protein
MRIISTSAGAPGYLNARFCPSKFGVDNGSCQAQFFNDDRIRQTPETPPRRHLFL